VTAAVRPINRFKCSNDVASGVQRTHLVRMLDAGFEYGAQRFASLSAIAKEITGTKWNGYLFFGLVKESRSG
jgi:hypothetical protein